MNQFKNMSRRELIRYATAAATLPFATSGVYASQKDERKGEGRIVVIGGGFGGTATAKYLKRYNPELNVTLIEPQKQYLTCPGSNWVIAGFKPMNYITHDYTAIKSHGVNLVHEMVENVDFSAKKVVLKNGDKIWYDKLVVAPGIDFKWDIHDGATAEIAETLPHAYKAGAQTTLLKNQLESMPRGGTFAIVSPPNPYRCPPGPYERASMVAHRLKLINPTAKILILDQKKKFAKKKMFMEGWKQLYGNTIEWRAVDKGGKVKRVDAKNKLITTSGEEIRADVINYIPPQKAGKLAFTLGLTNKSGYCPIDHITFESKLKKDVHVLGDAVAGRPKSGQSASTQAKICAANIVRNLAGYDPVNPNSVNSCYSLVAPDYGITASAMFDVNKNKVVKIGGSPVGANRGIRAQEAMFAQGWYHSITREVWG